MPLILAARRTWFKKMADAVRVWRRRKYKAWFPIRHAKNVGLSLYTKPFQSSQNLVTRLIANGLGVPNPVAAADFLKANNYYRFKVYLRPFLTSPTAKNFVAGSTFGDALELYEFDEELRAFVFGLTSMVELQLRHEMDQRLSVFTGDPFWYLNKAAYDEFPGHTLSLLRSSLSRSREEFAQHFQARYHNGLGGPNNFLPPFWIASELLTVGQLNYLLKSFSKPFFAHPTATPPRANELDALALHFGAFNVGHLQKWVEYVRNLRNWCAHHSRLWNRHMATPPNLGSHLSKAIHVPSQHRLYHSLVMLRVMLRSAGISDGIKPAMVALFAKYPVADAKKAAMGFPVAWQTDPFW